MNSAEADDPIVRAWRELRRELAALRRTLQAQWGRSMVAWRNWRRRLRKRRLEFVTLEIGGPLPERDGPARSFWHRWLPLPAEPLSIQSLNARLTRLADAGNVRGVILIIDGLGGGLATLQSVRDAITRVSDAGKETVAYVTTLDLPHYYVASAARNIVAPPSASFEVLGLYAETIFLKDALARAGILAEFVQISPYKNSPDRLTRSDMSPEMREELEWLLDDQYEQLIAGMVETRAMEPEEMRRLIDGAPYQAAEAKELGLLDHVAYEDELPWLLAAPMEAMEAEPSHAESLAEGSRLPANRQQRPKARIDPWSSAWPYLLERHRPAVPGAVGVITISGTLAMGPNRRPPIDLPIPLLGGSVAGEQTLVGLLRRFERRRDLKALVLHVDSPGGVALAADLVHRELERIAKKKPVVAYFGDVAASGGYYIGAPARAIVAQPGSTTGSIGVFKGKLAVSGLYAKLDMNHVALQRGERAGLYRSPGPLSESERRLFEGGIGVAYDQFKQVVCRGRGIEDGDLEPIAQGRVWTGKQALAHRLVDHNGDFRQALRLAAEFAGMPTGDDRAIPVLDLYRSPPRRLVPQPAELPGELLAWLEDGWLHELGSGGAFYLLPITWRMW